MKECPAIETERLLLRPFELSDAKDIQCLAGDRAIVDTTLNIPHPYGDGMAEDWISTHRPMFEAGELSNFAIVLKGAEHDHQMSRHPYMELEPEDAANQAQ